MGASTKYYQNNPEARAKKQAYDKKLNSRKEQIQKRVESNRARRNAHKKGQNIEGKDYDHAVNRFVATAANRGRKGEGNR